ncbi:hypothetical protein CVT24_011075 [Panaeolus cyanescens]|uniref:CDC20/Fizzy WD40 domain-containing protein n=1 Tax=Panaeolus cyanescens TaxID=181874 RepID=A0A409YYB2_9AGAR|nr:hypothetical protein CVT24_011075 [Panaeolus cyanescens]
MYSTPKTPAVAQRHRAKSISKPSTTAITPGGALSSTLYNLNITNSGSPTKGKGTSAAIIGGKTTGNARGLQRKKSTTASASGSVPAAFDTSVSNPFITSSSRSRPSSPVKRPLSRSASSNTPNETLSRQAKAGVIRKGGVESRLEVVTHDYIPQPPAQQPQKDLKRSKSNPGINRSTSSRDRFITTRDSTTDLGALSNTLHQMSLNPPSSPGHTARLAEATGVPLGNRRILGYHEQPPLPTSSSTNVLLGAGGSDATLNAAREFAKPLYATRPGALASSNGTALTKSRKLPSQPDRVLDAEGIPDDFYLNLISWSSLNVVGVALANVVYLWNADAGTVQNLGSCPEGTYVSSVDFSNDGAFIAVGLGNGDVELWDTETGQKLRTMSGHSAQVGCMSWFNHIVSSGCEDGSVWHHDVRVGRHKVMELLGHSGAVCGVKWRADGELLASGGNDNVVNIWDGRVGDAGENGDARGSAKWTKRNHTAAVKALAWCPWSPSLLATGGGTNDATIHIWNSTTGARLHSLSTPAQISSIHFAKHTKEIVTTHGYPTHSVMIHSYPGMERVGEIRDAHECRVLGSVVGPSGETLCTVAADENLKFWRLWDVASQNAKKKKQGMVGSHAGEGKTKEGVLTLR